MATAQLAAGSAAPAAQVGAAHPRPRLLVVASALTLLGALPWVTGIVVAGAFVAPLVFGIIGNPSEAGTVMQPIFLRLDKLYLVCAALLLLGEGLRLFAVGPARFAWRNLLRAPLAVGMAVLGLYGALFVHPEMAQIRADGLIRGEGPGWLRFDHLHKLAEGMGKAVVFAGLLLLILVFVDAWAHARSRSQPQ